MLITVNNQRHSFSDEQLSVAALLAKRGVRQDGTAVAVNGSLCRRDNWEACLLHDGDDVTIISAAFGG